MEAASETPERVMAGPAPRPADVAGREPAATPAGALRRLRWVRKLIALALLAVMLGAALERFARVNSPENRYRRALLALANDDLKQAQSELLRLQAVPGFESHASVIAGVLLLQEHRPNEALDEFRAAVEHPETRALAWTLAGRTLLQQRRFQAAENAFMTALSYDPTLAEAHRGLAGAYFEVGDMPMAMGHLNEAAELSPQDPRPHRFMATIARSAGQVEAAIDYLRESLRRNDAGAMHMGPEARHEVLLELAQVQVDLLRHDEALETLRDVADTADALNLRADCHYARGDLDAARNCLTRTLALEPEHSSALLLHGRLALEANDLPAALESLTGALEQRPLDRTVHYVLAQCYYRLGRGELAQQHADKAQQLRDLSDEFEEMNQSAVFEPRNPLTCFKLGLMAEQLGRNPMAAYWYRATLLLNPRHTQARDRLSRLPGGLSKMDGQP